MKEKLMIFLHFFIGIGAMAGGSAAILNPQEPLGITTDMLHNGPFTDYFIPGIFLFLVIGLTNFLSGIFSIRQRETLPFSSFLMGGVLCLWIVVQCFILSAVAVLHIVFFLIGLVQVLLSAKVVREWTQVTLKNFNKK